MKKYIFTTLLFAAALHSLGQNVNELIKEPDVERIIKTLSADDMQGRATFTPGIEKAAQFIEAEYRQAGLKPLTGSTAGYRQNFTMIKSTPVNTQVSINGTAIAPENVYVSSDSPLSWTNSSDAVIAKIDTQKNFQTAYRNYMYSGKKMLLLIDPKFESYFRRYRNYIIRGSVTLKDDNSQQMAVVLGSFNEVKAFSVKYENKKETLPLFNIAGMIPGKAKPNEYVVFSGHYDHLGIIKPVEGDSIANGADDDASGTTAVITLAKYYKKLNSNARTLIFVAFTAEEIGEYGSQYFAAQVKPDEVKAMFNIEMIGKASKFGPNSAFITGYERSDFGQILQRNLQNTAFKFYPDPYPQQDLFYRSDNASLARVGVPAHTISTDQIDVDKYYHTVKDELSTLDVNNITSTIRAIALSSRSIVDGKDTPTRVAKLER